MFQSNNSAIALHHPLGGGIRETHVWISDAEVHTIFSNVRCYYWQVRNRTRYEANGVFVRYKTCNDGSLGYVLKNPIDGQNWLWAIGKRDRRPFKLAKVS